MPRSAASATAARRRWVLPVAAAPQIRKPGAPSSPPAKRSSAATSSRFPPGKKFEKRGGSGGASSKVSCSKSAVQVGGDVCGAQVPQPHQQRRADREGEEHARETEELSEGEQREDHRKGMQADAIADQPRDEHVVLEQLADAVDREHGEKAGQSRPLQKRRHHPQRQPQTERSEEHTSELQSPVH